MILLIVFAFTIEWGKVAVDHICNATTAENSRGSVTTGSVTTESQIPVLWTWLYLYLKYTEARAPLIFGHTFFIYRVKQGIKANTHSSMSFAALRSAPLQRNASHNSVLCHFRTSIHCNTVP